MFTFSNKTVQAQWNAKDPKPETQNPTRAEGTPRKSVDSTRQPATLCANPVEREYMAVMQAEKEIAERMAKLEAISNGTWTACHNIKVKKAA